MNTTLRRDADEIICSSIQAVLPDKAVCRALEDFQPGGGRVLLVAAGKAAWQMAHAAVQALGRVDGGVVVTKYGHVKGKIPGISCYEAGHPVPEPRTRGVALVIVGVCWLWALYMLGDFMATALRPLAPGETASSAGDFTRIWGPWIIVATVIVRRRHRISTSTSVTHFFLSAGSYSVHFLRFSVTGTSSTLARVVPVTRPSIGAPDSGATMR